MPNLVQFNIGILDKNKNLRERIEFYLPNDFALAEEVKQQYWIKYVSPAALSADIADLAKKKFAAYTAKITDWKGLENLFKYFSSQMDVYYNYGSKIYEVKSYAEFEYAIKSQVEIMEVQNLHFEFVKYGKPAQNYPRQLLDLIANKTTVEEKLNALEEKIRAMQADQLRGIVVISKRESNYSPSRFFPMGLERDLTSETTQTNVPTMP